MRTVTFCMTWEVSGLQSIDLPDDINIDDKAEVMDYLKGVWEDIPLPDGDYIPESDHLDDTVDLTFCGEVDTPQIYINPAEDLPAAINRRIKVEWTNLGEGINGDYEEGNPADVNLLRFDVYILRNGRWKEVDDASYCTEMPADTDVDTLKRAAAYLAKEYAMVLGDDPNASVKKLGERLSWICPDWFNQTPGGNHLDEAYRSALRKRLRL